MKNRNVTNTERLITFAVASGAMGLLARRVARSPQRSGLMAASGIMMLRAVTGYCPMYQAMGRGREGSLAQAKRKIVNDMSMTLQQTIVLRKSREEAFAFVRDPDNLRQLASDLATKIGELPVPYIAKAAQEFLHETLQKTPPLDLVFDHVREPEDVAFRSRTSPDDDALRGLYLNKGRIKFKERPDDLEGCVMTVSLTLKAKRSMGALLLMKPFTLLYRRVLKESLRLLKERIESGELASTQRSSNAMESADESAAMPVVPDLAEQALEAEQAEQTGQAEPAAKREQTIAADDDKSAVGKAG